VKQMELVAALTREHWQGDWNSWGSFHLYRGKMPIVATTLELLREHGPAGPAFWRFGREERPGHGLPRLGLPDRGGLPGYGKHAASRGRCSPRRGGQPRLCHPHRGGNWRPTPPGTDEPT
jgi:hypothetical protein